MEKETEAENFCKKKKVEFLRNFLYFQNLDALEITAKFLLVSHKGRDSVRDTSMEESNIRGN